MTHPHLLFINKATSNIAIRWTSPPGLLVHGLNNGIVTRILQDFCRIREDPHVRVGTEGISHPIDSLGEGAGVDALLVETAIVAEGDLGLYKLVSLVVDDLVDRLSLVGCLERGIVFRKETSAAHLVDGFHSLADLTVASLAFGKDVVHLGSTYATVVGFVGIQTAVVFYACGCLVITPLADEANVARLKACGAFE